MYSPTTTQIPPSHGVPVDQLFYQAEKTQRPFTGSQSNIDASEKSSKTHKTLLISAILLGIITLTLIVVLIVGNLNYMNLQNELAITKNELNDTNTALTVAKRQLLQINESAANPLKEPELTLRIFLDYAKNKDYQRMFQMLTADSQKTYADINDFIKRNPAFPLEYHGTAENGKITGIFVIDSYSINTGLFLPTYRNFNNVVSFDIEIMTTVDPAIRVLGSIATAAMAAQYGIPQVGELTNELLKGETSSKWIAHCVKNNQTWEIICDATKIK